MVCQGEVTEPEYFQAFARIHHRSDPCARAEPLDPVKLVEHAAKVAQERAATQVYVVVDVDDTPDAQIYQAIALCKAKSNRNCSFSLVVSNESVDCWLFAHVAEGRVPEQPRAYFQKNLAARDHLTGRTAKHLSKDFPVEAWEQAEKSIAVVELNELGPNPSTAIPTLIRALLAVWRTYR